MIVHLLKLVWNRRRSNLMIGIEVLLSYIVMTAVVTTVVFFTDNYRRPLGFEIEHVWRFTVDTNEGPRNLSENHSVSDGAAGAAPTGEAPALRASREGLAQLVLVLRDLPEVEAASVAAIVPYSGNNWRVAFDVNGRQYAYSAGAGTDDFARALGLHLVQGRWFSHEDDGSIWHPVVINQRLARDLFGEKSPVGRFVDEAMEPETNAANRQRVVGVVDDFRKGGEFAPPDNFLFQRIRLDVPATSPMDIGRFLIVRVRPQASSDFEERAMDRLRAARPDWTFQAERLSQARETTIRTKMAPVSAAALVAGFLLLMVTLGLTGVLWMHITQRTNEVGLRRAKGATRRAILRQLVGEVVLLTAGAVVVGSALVAQVPLLGLIGEVGGHVFGISIALSGVAVLTLTAICAWVPARMASRIEPADALRYE